MKRLAIVAGALLVTAASLGAADAEPKRNAEVVPASAGRSADVSEARLPLRTDPVVTGGTLARVVAATSAGLVLVWLAILALRRWGFGVGGASVPGRRIQLLEARRLTRGASLLLVRIGDRDVLLGQTGDRLVMLSDETGRTGGERAHDG